MKLGTYITMAILIAYAICLFIYMQTDSKIASYLMIVLLGSYAVGSLIYAVYRKSKRDMLYWFLIICLGTFVLVQLY
ncbi:hypothetical protein [Alkalihalobacillus sp. TS-13]|uniref:hypothetical protein n=1 Tax=Alkalihalobacillus sp. TS-13 TaxID=2842455 RepID=UPI001C879E30|nr:hypothetical protein [Alkalihalobacillus sp. TS-13]